MLYVIRVYCNGDEQIDAWSNNEYLVRHYLKHESIIHPQTKYSIEEWDDTVSYGNFPYELDPTKELIVKKNLIGDCYLISRGDYVTAINGFLVQVARYDGSKYFPAEQPSTIATILGVYSIFIKNNNLCTIIRELRKRDWKLDPFTYESRMSASLRKRKI